MKAIVVIGRKHFVGGVSAAAFETNIKAWRKIRAKWPTDSIEYRKATRHISKLTQMLHEFERRFPTKGEE